jgi:Membrane domain of glycerophosphoryl diester phosphodiesterase
MRQGDYTRPLDFGQTIDAGFKLGRKCFLPIASIAILVWIPLVVSAVLALDLTTTHYEVTGDSTIFGADSANITRSSDFLYALAEIWGYLAAYVGPVITFALVYPLLADRAAGGTMSWRASLKVAFTRFGPLLVTLILGFLGLLAGYMLLIIPGIFLSIAWIVTIPAFYDEGVSGSRALGRSMELTRGRWWPIFGRYFVFVLITNIMAGVLSSILLAAALGALDHGSTGALVALQVAPAVGAVLVAPFVSAFVAVLYFDALARRGVARDDSPSGETFGDFAPPKPPATPL